MKTWAYKAVLVLVVAAVTMMAALPGTSASSGQTSQEHPLPKGGRVIIRNQSGAITIRGWDKDSVRAVIAGPEREGEAGIKVSEDSEGLTITRDIESRRYSSEADLVVDVPRSATIESARTSNGDIMVTGVSGSVTVGTGHGEVKAQDTGPLSAASAAGDITVSQINGPATLQSGSGDVKATSVKGPTGVISGSGDVQVNDSGPVNLRTGGGDITAIGVKGSATVQTGSGDVTVRELSGDCIAKVTSGDVNLYNVGGLVNLGVTSGDVNVDHPAGDVRIASISGSIGIKCAGGNVEVRSADGSITLTGIAGDIDAGTTSGDVSFAGVIRTKGRYRLKSISGGVSMAIQPDTPGFTATLSSFSGEIDTDFPIKLDNVLQRGPVSRRVIGRYGNGQADITLDSFSGTVTLSKMAKGRVIDCK